jgi:hypothetical protein
MDAAVAEADAFALKHIERPAEHLILSGDKGVAAGFPTVQHVTRQPSAIGQVVTRESGQCPGSVKKIPCDSHAENLREETKNINMTNISADRVLSARSPSPLQCLALPLARPLARLNRSFESTSFPYRAHDVELSS